MLASSIPYKFKTPWGASATAPQYITSPIPQVSTGPAAGQDLGFPPATATDPSAGGTPPNINDVNGALNYETLWSRWIQAGAPVGYDATFSSNIGGYPKGARLWPATGTNVWISTVDNNTSNPDAGGANWTTLQAQNNTWTGSNTWSGGGTFNTATVTFNSNIVSHGANSWSGTSSFTGAISSSANNSWTGGNFFSGPVTVLAATAGNQPVSLGQFVATVSGLTTFFTIMPNGIIDVSFNTTVPIGVGLTSTVVTLPVNFTAFMDQPVVVWDGNAPPLGASVSGLAGSVGVGTSVVAVTTNGTTSGAAGIVIRVRGF